MTKQELFQKYNINETHNVWEDIDSWMSVELYRVMHNGNLPTQNDTSVKWITEFLDKIKTDTKLIQRNDFGNLFLTAKRMIYLLSDQIIAENS